MLYYWGDRNKILIYTFIFILFCLVFGLGGHDAAAKGDNPVVEAETPEFVGETADDEGTTPDKETVSDEETVTDEDKETHVGWTPTAAEGWRAVTETDLRVLPGSALDFSSSIFPDQTTEALGPVRANTRGQLIVGDYERRRFFCAPYSFAGPKGRFPDHEYAEALAIELRRNGYNLVRVHMADRTLFANASEDLDYDAEQLDRFHYFLSELKKNGIYWMIDAATSDTGAYALSGSRWGNDEYSMRIEMHFKPDAQEHWKDMVRLILARKNPYTGLNTLEDNALLAITIMNEGGIRFNLNPGKLGEATDEF